MFDLPFVFSQRLASFIAYRIGIVMQDTSIDIETQQDLVYQFLINLPVAEIEFIELDEQLLPRSFLFAQQSKYVPGQLIRYLCGFYLK
jgi:hypothetical protein